MSRIVPQYNVGDEVFFMQNGALREGQVVCITFKKGERRLVVAADDNHEVFLSPQDVRIKPEGRGIRASF